MAELNETVASVRFHGEDLDPEEISRALGAQPTRGRKKGSVWTTPNGKELIARSGYWSLSVDSENPGDLDKQITAIFSLLSDDLDIWRTYATRYRGSVFAGLRLFGFNEAIGLLPATLSAIGARGLELELDIYSGKDNGGQDI